MKKTGIFGGTFNPPHMGHRHIACGFAERFELNRILIVPTCEPPHKPKSELASPEDRMALCRLTFDRPDFEVSPIEVERTGKSYTYDTLRELHDISDDDYYFLLGDDMLLSFDHWWEPEKILGLCHLVTTVRSDRTSTEELKRYAQSRFPEAYSDGRFLFMDIPPLDVSSTDIRQKVREGESIHGLVAPAAERYILQRGLYQ